MSTGAPKQASPMVSPRQDQSPKGSLEKKPVIEDHTKKSIDSTSQKAPEAKPEEVKKPVEAQKQEEAKKPAEDKKQEEGKKASEEVKNAPEVRQSQDPAKSDAPKQDPAKANPPQQPSSALSQ